MAWHSRSPMYRPPGACTSASLRQRCRLKRRGLFVACRRSSHPQRTTTRRVMACGRCRRTARRRGRRDEGLTGRARGLAMSGPRAPDLEHKPCATGQWTAPARPSSEASTASRDVAQSRCVVCTRRRRRQQGPSQNTAPATPRTAAGVPLPAGLGRRFSQHFGRRPLQLSGEAIGGN